MIHLQWVKRTFTRKTAGTFYTLERIDTREQLALVHKLSAGWRYNVDAATIEGERVPSTWGFVGGPQKARRFVEEHLGRTWLSFHLSPEMPTTINYIMGCNKLSPASVKHIAF